MNVYHDLLPSDFWNIQLLQILRIYYVVRHLEPSTFFILGDTLQDLLALRIILSLGGPSISPKRDYHI